MRAKYGVSFVRESDRRFTIVFCYIVFIVVLYITAIYWESIVWCHLYIPSVVNYYVYLFVPWSSCHTGPDSKVHGANTGPTWVLSAPDGPQELCYQGCYVPGVTHCFDVCRIVSTVIIIGKLLTCRGVMFDSSVMFDWQSESYHYC